MASLKQWDAERILARFVKEAGIERRLSPHSVRATVTTRALANGAPPLAVQELLGVCDLGAAMRYNRAGYGGDNSPVHLLDPPESP